MILRAGTIIKSTAALNDTAFADTAILIVEDNTNGALGFVINQPFERSLNELAEFNDVPYFSLYRGGPVDMEHLFFIHQRPGIITGGKVVNNGVYYGGDFGQAVTGIRQAMLSSNDIKIFVGYCGWDADELEQEIAEGSWEFVVTGVDVFKGCI